MMNFKVQFLAIFLALAVPHVTGQSGSLTCAYWPGWMTEYFCMLDIDNPDGHDEFVSIYGDHTPGYSNFNVDTIYGLAAREGSAKVIPSIICDTFVNVRDLWVDKLSVGFVTERTFRACENLESLYLGYNELSQLPFGVFAGNLKLKLLDLGKNHLSTIQSNFFENITTLEKLYLDGNHFKRLDAAWFAPLTNLRELKLAKNEIFELQSGIFASQAQLQLLDVSDNHLTVINSNSFASTLSSLRTLTAGYNRIDAIDPNFFNTAAALTSVDLSGNVCIDKILTDDHTPLGDCFVNFGDADLSCTYMRGYFTPYFCLLDVKNPHGRDDFAAISGTHRINRGDANITAVYADTTRDGYVKNVPSVICRQYLGLLDLYLDGLNIEIVTERSFEECKVLENLYLSDNLIEDLEADTFVNNEKLKMLDLGNNHLTSLPPTIFSTLLNLKQLYLDGNFFIDLNSEIFNTLNSLTTLWLSNSGVTSLKTTWFDSLEQLEVLHLDRNDIMTLPDEIFAANRALKVLRLDSNKLRALSAASFSTRMDQFSEIYANHNQITEIDQEFFNITETLEIAEFEGNECIDWKFKNFSENRGENLEKFAACFGTSEETTTAGGGNQWSVFVRVFSVVVGIVGVYFIGF